jgi:hypothetical protein
MTNEQSKKFSQLLDANWDCDQAVKSGKYMQAFELAETVAKLKRELREDMGAEEYDKFIENGRKMFSPIKLTVNQ